jgi:hypothetical protein
LPTEPLSAFRAHLVMKKVAHGTRVGNSTKRQRGRY